MKDAGRIGFRICGDYDPSATYEFLDVVYYGTASYVAKKGTIGNSPEYDNEYWHILAGGNENIGDVTGVKGDKEAIFRTGYVNLTPDNIGALAESGDASGITAMFVPALERANIATGENLATIFGKLAKIYVDMHQVAFSGSYADLTDTPPESAAVESTYSPEGENPVNGKAVSEALKTLDAESAGGEGKYIQSISETDGKINAVAADMPKSLPANGGNADTVGGKTPEALQDYTGLTNRPQWTTMTVNLPAGWAGTTAPFTKNYAVSGMTADAIVWVDIAKIASAEQFDAYVNARIANGGQSNNTLTFKAFGENPTVSIPLDIAFLKE